MCSCMFLSQGVGTTKIKDDPRVQQQIPYPNFHLKSTSKCVIGVLFSNCLLPLGARDLGWSSKTQGRKA